MWSYPIEPERSRTFYARPAVDDEMVVVTDYTDSVTALNPETGQELWTFSTDKARFIGGAVVDAERVYAGSVDGTLHALDRTNGQEAWTFSAERDIWSTPLLDGDTLYVTSLDRHVYALNAATGDLDWQFPADGQELDPKMGAIVSTPTLHEGVMYFGSFNNQVYAVDIETRDVLWTYETTNWVWSSPVVDEESGLLVGADLDGHIFGLQVETGEPAWTYDVDGPVVGQPVIADLVTGKHTALITSEDGNLYLLNPADGTMVDTPSGIEAEFTTRFLFVQTGTDTRPIPLFAAPVLYNDLILLGAHEGNTLLYALDQDTLLERWHFEPSGS
jgi:outer membrane protein assembly factor BamB